MALIPSFNMYDVVTKRNMLIIYNAILRIIPIPAQEGNAGLFLYTDGTDLSWAAAGVGSGITTLNTLTALSQSFATGTSGTDFNISSVTATHTFNLPTASATNRGALSTTDWSTFNGKQDAISLTTIGTSGAATFIANVLNIPQYSGGSSFITSILDTTTIDLDVTLGVLTANFINVAGYITLGSLSAVAPITYNNTTGVISTSMSTNKLIGRGTAATGVMEEITLGTNLSFSGTTLNATGGSNAGSISITISGFGGVISIGQVGGFLTIPFNGTITGWIISSVDSTGAALSGSCVIGTYKDTYANFPPTSGDEIFTDKPTLTAQSKNTNLAPAFIGAGATVTSGDMIGFYVISCTTCVLINVTLLITKS